VRQPGRIGLSTRLGTAEMRELGLADPDSYSIMQLLEIVFRAQRPLLGGESRPISGRDGGLPWSRVIAIRSQTDPPRCLAHPEGWSTPGPTSLPLWGRVAHGEGRLIGPNMPVVQPPMEPIIDPHHAFHSPSQPAQYAREAAGLDLALEPDHPVLNDDRHLAGIASRA
jgi:hypothetical protein